jgi:O-antigen/teichoic acid export membrane protein
VLTLQKNSLVNIVGLALAALILFLATPIISRLISPAEYGVFGVFVASISIIAGLGCGKYEVAIILPKDDTEAAQISVLCIILGLSTAAFAGLLALQLPRVILYNSALIILLPLGVFFAVLWQVVTSTLIRMKAFRALAMSRVAMAATTATSMVALALAIGDAISLVIGYVCSQGIVSLAMVALVARNWNVKHNEITIKNIARQAEKYKAFPLQALPSDFANALSLRLPMWALATIFGSAAAGTLAMFERIWSASSVFSRGIGETFRQTAADSYRVQGDCIQPYRQTFWILLALALMAFIMLVFLGPLLLPLILGSEWEQVGLYGQLLAPLVCIQFVSSTMGWSIYVAQKLLYNTVWQWSMLLAYIIVFLIGAQYKSETFVVGMYSVVGTLWYGVYLFISYRVAKGK